MALKKETSNLYTFDPEHVAGLVAKKDWSGCWEYLAQVAENFDMSASTSASNFVFTLQQDMKDGSFKKYVNDFGGLLGELLLYLLSDKDSMINDKSFYRLIYLQETIHTLLYINDMDNTDAAVQEILAKPKLNSVDQKKILILLSLNTNLDIVEILKRIDEPYRMAAVVAFGGHRKIFKETVYKNKVKLYELRDEYEKPYDSKSVLTYMINVYFQSSYLNIPNKHSIKENINKAYRKFLSDNARDLKKNLGHAPLVASYDLDPSKPTVLVVTELFATNHAMYRCWGKRTRGLQKDFNVVFMIPADKTDSALKDEYKNFIAFENVGDVYQIAHQVKPDILFMPSVGMRFFNVVLSNMRVAPVQIMGLGHPATTMSEYIDYVISDGYLYNEKAFPKDAYIDDGYIGDFIPLLSREKFLQPLKEEEKKSKEDKTVNIAVVGSDTKVSYPFFRLLKEIVATSPFKIHVTFMMATGGVDTLYMEKYLQENFENYTFYGWQLYPDYIQRIKSVDIVLNPFPFGHANTIIDTLMCHKPCIGMDGPEPSSKTEGYILKMADLEEQFVAKDEEDYKRKFFSLAERILNGETSFFDREKVYDAIFAQREPAKYDYSTIFKWVLENDKELKAAKAKGKKLFLPFEDI